MHMQDLMKHNLVDGPHLDMSRGSSEEDSPSPTARLEGSQQGTYRSATAYDSVASKSKSVGNKVKLIKESVHISTTPYRASLDPAGLDISVLKQQNAQISQLSPTKPPSGKAKRLKLMP